MKENEICMLHILFQSLTNLHNLLFNMPSFSSNYPYNSSSETLNCCRQLPLRYFDPSFKQRHFQRLYSCVWWATGLSSKHGPNTEVYWVEIGWWSRPQFFAAKPQEIVSAPPSMGWENVWEGGEISIFEVLLHITLSRDQNVIDIHICIDFDTLFHKNHRRFPSFWHFSPSHDRWWLLAAING